MRLLVMFFVATAVGRPAAADVTMFDQGRALPRGASASRDAPAFGTILVPRTVMTAATELAAVVIHRDDLTVRLTFAGLLEIEADRDADHPSILFSPVGAKFWRGAYAYSVALAPRTSSAAYVVEATATARHETAHVTAPAEVHDVPLVGDELALDLAVAHLAPCWSVVGRAEARWFIPGHSAYRIGPALDLQLRWTAHPRWQPFVSAFAEYRTGADATPDAYLLRALGGVAIPGALGDVLVFVAADTGNRAGFAVSTRESTIGAGVRFALGTVRGRPR